MFFWGPRVFPEEKHRFSSKKDMEKWRIYLVSNIHNFQGVPGFIEKQLEHILILYMM